jgi:phage shock protein A
VSIANFSGALRGLGTTLDRIEQKLDRVKQKIENTKGPLDSLIAQAEKAGSAVGALGNAMVEVVSLDQSNWTPALQAVQWQLYEVQKAAKETEVVSRDVLDKISNLVDERMPHFELWLKKILQMRADGELTLDEMQQKIDDFATSVGVAQLNSMYHDDIPGFVIEFRKLMEEIKRGEKTMDEAGAALDEITGKAKTATKEVEKTRNTVAGITKGSAGGSMGASSSSSSSGSSASGGSMTPGSLAVALQSLTRRS